MTAREEILRNVGRALGRTAWDKASIAAHGEVGSNHLSMGPVE
jgi:hypothetical protein